jgi:hypothetical protein
VSWRPPDPYSYSYLLGLYLGDGCVCVRPAGGGTDVRITLDAAYPEIVEGCVTAMQLTAPNSRVTVRRLPSARAVVVASAGQQWPEAFPQHGAGRKHERPIHLAGWQRAVVDRFPERLLAGLIHSDGCRTLNRFRTTLPSGRIASYEYPRYFFSNRSADIRSLFCEYCERLGIRWSQSNSRNISIAHRDSVARLDRFVGPKR